jgi:hypothetical protein
MIYLLMGAAFGSLASKCETLHPILIKLILKMDHIEKGKGRLIDLLLQYSGKSLIFWH